MSKEVWKNVPDSDGKYQVSNLGRIKRGNNIRKPSANTKRYYFFAFLKNNKRYSFCVHRLVANLFIPNPDNKPQVNHINCIKNDNRVENLEWVTNKENAILFAKSGFRKVSENRAKGTKVNTCKLTPSKVTKIKKMYSTGRHGYTYIAKIFGVSDTAIRYIIIGRNWKWIQ